ncbi:predicted protein [Naegleria gruberi]|uniref:Predicted protein n=1 Tax=Naegleria gruberi TaxID=5762 RepID=D2W2C9_NAEGR|nr:uncharacterized protein NAEGRDRAFT_75544 [Naegleria gruberi]EFC36804.1 predicted protein [Naegleria gruberi]|eukprot:XP_002669548.1 predicted protein [Naegleria gruberi strain NEG-M]
MPVEEKKKKAKKASKASNKSTDQTISTPTNGCYVCHKTNEGTDKQTMLTCKTCGLKVHAGCYENTHFSLKYADSWECVDCKKCEVCKDANYREGNEILMCNRCDKGYHQLCCSEKFRTVPEGDKPWFCESCVDYLKEKKQKKKRKVEKPVTKSESAESLFKLKPGKHQKVEDKQAPIATTTPSSNETTSTIKSSTPPPPPSSSVSSTNGSTNDKEPVLESNGHKKEQHAQTEVAKENINIFIIYKTQQSTLYSCSFPFPSLDGPTSQNRSLWSDKYFKQLCTVIFNRLSNKMKDLIEDKCVNAEIKKMVKENTFIIDRVALKEKDRFGGDILVDLDRIYFEDYELRSGDTLVVDLSIETKSNGQTIRWSQ